MPRTRGATALGISATIGGMLGLLAGLLELPSHVEVGGWGLFVILVILVVSMAELAFAYSASTQTPWALKPGPRAAGFAVAIALMLLGAYDIIARVGGA